MNNSIRLLITSCVNSVIKLFQENPCDFLSKREIQAFLHSYLRVFVREKVSLPHPFGDEAGGGWIETSIIRSEFPSLGRFDISVLHPEIGRRKSNIKMGKDRWNLPLLGAIDLEFCEAGGQFYKRLHSFTWKMDRLSGFKDTNENKPLFEFGLALFFSQMSLDSIRKDGFGIVEVSEVEEVHGVTGYIIETVLKKLATY